MGDFPSLIWYGSAALSLGCSLSKTSRSQRNKPRCYLSPSTEEVPNVIYDTAQNANRRDNTTKSHHVSRNGPATSKKQCLQPPKVFQVYPLCYYGNNNIQLDDSQHGFKVSHKSVSNTSGPAIGGVAQNLLLCNLNPSLQGSQSFIMNVDPNQTPSTNKCDLSLRLGPLSIPPSSFENGQVQEAEISSKLNVQTSQKDEKMKL